MSEDKKMEFHQKMIRYRGLIYWLVKHYGRIESRHDQEDFYQEALIALYTSFHKYDQYPGSSFPAWLAKVVKFSISSYRRYYYRISHWTEYTEDMGVHSDMVYEVPSKDNYEVVKMAMARLSGEDKMVIQMVLNDENLSANSQRDGKNIKYYSDKFGSACRRMRYQIYGKPKRRTTLNKGGKPVCRMNMLGDILEVYPSVMDAERNGFNSKNIHQAIHGKRRSCGGFLWKYVDSD